MRNLLLIPLLLTLIFLSIKDRSKKNLIWLFIVLNIAAILTNLTGITKDISKGYSVILFIFLLLLSIKNRRVKLDYWSLFPIILVWGTGIFSAFFPLSKLLYGLTQGYDNEGHIPLLWRTYSTGGFLWSPLVGSDGFSTWANVSNSYPLQNAGFASLLFRISGVVISGTDELVRAYFFVTATTFIMLALLIAYTFIKGGSNKNKKIVGILIFTGIFAGAPSALFWGGFPPTVWGILIVACYFSLDPTKMKAFESWILLLLSSVVINYSYQLFAPALMVVAGYKFIENFRNRNFKLSFSFLVIPPISIILALPIFLHSKIVSSYIFHFGGILVPHRLSVLLVIYCCLVIFKVAQRKIELDAQIFSFLAITAVAEFSLAIATIDAKGVYYPAKIIYFAIILGLFTLPKILTGKAQLKNIQALKQKSRTRNARKISSVLIASCFLAVSVFDAFFGRGFNNSWMGSSIQNIPSMVLAQNKNCIAEIYHSVSTRNLELSKQTFFAVETDGKLNDFQSRWANALRGNMGDKIYDFSISGSGNTFTSVYPTWHLKYPDDSLVLVTMRKPGECK
jgi:hypothetical protein